ncbi:MAG: tryptophan--tRNA ligase [Rickettsiales bacterium]
MLRVVSGIQPSGTMQLGNYLGAIKNWLPLQDQYSCLFFLADMHTITVPQNPQELRENTIATAATYLACGLDPKKVILFNQSNVTAHAELGWILSCVTSIGWLERMTQFKDKGGDDKQRSSLGLFSYPVLQAADVLLYQADLVPVGEDQRQHLELARDIASSFNRFTNSNYFKLPEARIMKSAARIMSLRDGSKKMSKSDESDFSRINLIDSADLIMQKLKKAKTDSIAEIYYDKENRPEVSNLLEIYSSLAGIAVDDIVEQYTGKLSGQFKQDLAEVIIDKIVPIGSKIIELCKNDEAYVREVLSDGASKANAIAFKNITEIKNLCGFVS